MKKRYYGIVGTTRKEVQMVREKDSRGRWAASMQEVNVPTDVLVISDYEDRMDAISDIREQAAKLGKLKFEPRVFG